MTEISDVLGIGFGPANLGLAVAVEDHNDTAARPLIALFRERQPRFGWHRGMLLDDATMQVSFLKDLVTVRNPTSPFSFVAYLHERGRLIDFINHKSLFPLRAEFHDYLEWAAARVRARVHYGAEVVDVVPVVEGGVVRAFDVVSRLGDGRRTVDRARSLSLAAGLRASLPADAEPGPRIWHNLSLLDRVGELPAEPARVVVVGAGQSAAETTDFLHRTFPTAQVHCVFARYGFSPSDDSPFANRIFDPDAVDEFFHADAGVRQMLLGYHRNTNYSVVDGELIEELYRRVYQEKVHGAPRLHIHGASRVVGVQGRPDGVRLGIEHLPSGGRVTLDADVLVYATGCRPVDPIGLLGAAGALARRDAAGDPVVGRDYRVETTVPVEGGIWLHGGTERSHGITSTLLSNVAVRSGEIVAALAARRQSRTDALAVATSA